MSGGKLMDPTTYMPLLLHFLHARHNKWWSYVAINWWLSFCCVYDKVI